MNRLFNGILGSVFVLGVVLPLYTFAWSGPPVGVTPPNGNVAAPITVGAVAQVKNASLGVNGLAVFGNTILQTNSYLNFGDGTAPSIGSTGYGIRDNAGTLEFKNTGGTWASLQAIIAGFGGGGGSQWTTSGSNIYYNSGNVGIGTTSPSAKLDVNGSISASGNVTAAAFLYSSDRRLKKDIAPLAGNLDKVLALQPVTWLWKDTNKGTDQQIGFIAQDVQKVVPEVVHTNTATTLESIDYARLSPLLVGSVQELHNKIEEQGREIEMLTARINALEARGK